MTTAWKGNRGYVQMAAEYPALNKSNPPGFPASCRIPQIKTRKSSILSFQRLYSRISYKLLSFYLKCCSSTRDLMTVINFPANIDTSENGARQIEEKKKNKFWH